MGIGVLTIILVLSLLALFCLGMPVAFAMGAIAMVIGYFTWGPQMFNVMPTTAFSQISGFVLLAVPLFLFMGQMLLRSGLGEAMFQAMHILAGRVRGGLAMGVILVCTFLGAMVGIIGAGILTAGSLALPSMLERNYSKTLAMGAIMAGGSLGILIPPSIPMVLYCSVTGNSIGKLFAAGIVPGLMLSVLYVSYIAIRCLINPSLGPALGAVRKITFHDRLIAARDGGLALLLIFTVLGTIVFGLATPTEAAACGGAGAILIAIVYRKFNLKVLSEASVGTMKITGMLVWILIGASIFSNFQMLMGAQKLISGFTFKSGLHPLVIVFMMQCVMFVMGCFLDEYIIVLICAPLFTPAITAMGLDPIWFGILMIINLQIAVQTPPYGFALFYLKSITPKDINMMELYKAVVPFILLNLVALLTIMFFPSIATWLPNLLFN
jgi:tripartite ATP-independent transporter DctM subunit